MGPQPSNAARGNGAKDSANDRTQTPRVNTFCDATAVGKTAPVAHSPAFLKLFAPGFK